MCRVGYLQSLHSAWSDPSSSGQHLSCRRVKTVLLCTVTLQACSPVLLGRLGHSSCCVPAGGKLQCPVAVPVVTNWDPLGAIDRNTKPRCLGAFRATGPSSMREGGIQSAAKCITRLPHAMLAPLHNLQANQQRIHSIVCAPWYPVMCCCQCLPVVTALPEPRCCCVSLDCACPARAGYA